MIISSPVYFSVTTVLGGSANFSFRIPGTYGGLNPGDPTTGRYFSHAEFWCDTPTNGDKLTGLKLTDTDGILSAPEQAACPNYPDVVQLYDNASLPSGLNAGVFIHNNPPARIDSFDSTGKREIKFLPSGLDLVGTFTAGDGAISRVFRCNIYWGRWVNAPV